MRGSEDHLRPFLAHGQCLDQFDTVEQRHLDVGQHHVERLGIDQAQCLDAIAGEADDLYRLLRGDVAKQVAQAHLRRQFVVDDEDPEQREA